MKENWEIHGLELRSEGLRLAAEVYLPSGGPAPYPALCLCHGVPSGSPPDPTDRGYPLLAERFCREGFVTLIFNFRGAGESGGNFDILGWARDLGAALDYLGGLKAVDQARLSVMGFSGGAAVSVYVAAHDQRIRHLVACACPAELRALPDATTWEESLERFRSIGVIRDPDFPPSPQEWARGFQVVEPLRWVSRISPRPLLLIHGDRDQVVDPSHARRLYERAGEPRGLVMVEGGEHRLRQNQRAMQAALAWLKKTNGLGG